MLQILSHLHHCQINVIIIINPFIDIAVITTIINPIISITIVFFSYCCSVTNVIAVIIIIDIDIIVVLF